MVGIADGIRGIAQSRVRYGYRKVRVLLNREGWNVGKHLVYRLYKEVGRQKTVSQPDFSIGTDHS